jgi:hypothetical protein
MKFLDPRAQSALAALMARNRGLTPADEIAVTPIKPLNSISETKLLLGLGNTSVYSLINDGLLDARKLGKQTRITGQSIVELIKSLPRGTAESPRPEGVDPQIRRAKLDDLARRRDAEQHDSDDDAA